MFDKNYYCLVAGLREYSLDADTKGFNARAIIEEILEGVSARDARCVRLLYGYYDCENLVNFRKGRAAHNPLGNLSREEIEEQTKNPDRLPARMATVVRSYSAIVDEDADNEDGIDTDRSFENALFSAYYDVFEKSPTDITVTSPMTFGMIANLELQEIVLYSMIRKIDHILGFGATMYFTVPLDMTAVEKRAYFHVANGHWLKKNRVFMVEAPIADAIAMGVNLEDPEGNMIVNIGAQSTEVSIITGGKIIISRKIPLGGRQMNESVCSEIRKRYNLQIGTRTAKRLKMVMGRLSDPKKEVRKVVGIDCISGLPREEIISSYVVNDGIMNCLNEIAAEMKTFLERIPPQISYHIAKQGIYITGGSTRLPYIDKYLASYTGFTFNLSDFYETSAVTGLEKIIRNKELREWAVPVTQRKL